jgi:ABC-2 type transport system permease protein
MNAATDTVIEPSADAPTDRIADFPKPRMLYWSVRRELWENRSIWIAPLVVAALMLVGFVVGARRLTDGMRSIYMLDRALHTDVLSKPLSVTAVPIIATTTLVAIFYCLDALHGERRDRSILFWKSLPVSDLLTVLSKALVPLVVLPAVACMTVMALQLLVLFFGGLILQASGLDGTVLWTGISLAHLWGALIYGVVGLALWHAPIYAWLLLISGWAKRATFLFAVLPPLALCLVEKIAFDTAVVWSLLKDRLFGFMFHGFEGRGLGPPDPLALLATPGLWIGLVVAALMLATTVWFRRYRQPI